LANSEKESPKPDLASRPAKPPTPDGKSGERKTSGTSKLGRSGVKLDAPIYSQPKSYEKEELSVSDKWQLVDTPSWLTSEAQSIANSRYRRICDDIQEAINKSFSQSGCGTIAVLAIGIVLKRLKLNLKILNTKINERAWGDKKRKISILENYGCTEYIFDNYEQRREQILQVLMGEIRENEKLMRETAKDFGIEIPLQPQYDFFDKLGSFENNCEEFKNKA
jgi:hypothetical protein